MTPSLKIFGLFLIILGKTNIICSQNDECYCNGHYMCTFECNNCLNSKIYCNTYNNSDCTVNCLQQNSCKNITIYTNHSSTLILNKNNRTINIMCPTNNTGCTINCLRNNNILLNNDNFPISPMIIQNGKPIRPFWHFISDTELKIVFLCLFVILLLIFCCCMLLCFIWRRKHGNKENSLPSPKVVELRKHYSNRSKVPSNTTPSSGHINITPNSSVIFQPNSFVYIKQDLSSKTSNITPTITPTHSNFASMNFNKSVVFPLPHSRMNTAQISNISNILDDTNISDIESNIPDLPYINSSPEAANIDDIIHNKKNESVTITLNQIYHEVINNVDEMGILHELSDSNASDDTKTSDDDNNVYKDITEINKFNSEELYDGTTTETAGDINT